MAGFANSKERLKQAEERIRELEAELETLRDGKPAKRKTRRRITSRGYGPDIVDELIERSEAGEFMAEILARWGVDEDTFEGWMREHVELREAFGPARVRARAALFGMLRKALEGGRSFPVQLADRLMAAIEAEARGKEASASTLIRLDLAASGD